MHDEGGGVMDMHTASGFDATETMHARADRRERARIVASFAEYLAEDVDRNPDHALDAMASLAEWCEGDPELLTRARADVLRDISTAQASAVATNREAVELLDLVAQAS
jgi:hypothetical protein